MAGAETRIRWALIAALALALAWAPSALAQTPPTPIPTTNGPPPAPTYLGSPASVQPIQGIAAIPQNRFMAPNPLSEIHNDAWQSDIYRYGGPLGKDPQTFSAYLAPSRDCGSITFDHEGRILAICIALSGPELFMFDPNDLATLATFSLPPRTAEDVLLNPDIFQDFTAGGYFYLDNQDDVVTGTTNGHIYVIAENSGAPGFTLLHDYALPLNSDEEINSQLPDSNGLLWFTARRDGVVGTLNLSTGAVHVIRLGSGTTNEITKSLATDSDGGVYIPTNQKLYRFVAGPGGVPEVSWSVTYPNTGVAKPGQLDAGTGTTPVVSGPYVGINDNADPMAVAIYRNAPHPTRTIIAHGRRRTVAASRLVCLVPVFQKGASADENAMIAAGNSYLIENNYGYQNPTSVEGGQNVAPGFARVDINASGTGCRLVWTNTTVNVPTVVSKLSLANGLIYTYTTAAGTAQPWYWTALDFRTGRTVYQVLAGNGVGYNNNYAGIALGPNGTEYLGTLAGIIALRDGVSTAQPPPRPATPSRARKAKRHRTRHRRATHHRRAASFTG
jgi:hypothetical protein